VQRWWRVVSAYRGLALFYAVAIAIADRHDYSRPWLAVVLLVVMALWTAATIWLYDGRRRLTAVLVADLALAVAMVLATLAVLPRSRIDAGAATLPGPWAGAAVLAWGVARGPLAGVIAAAVAGAADVIVRGTLTQGTAYGVALLLIAGGLAGYVVQLSRRVEEATESAARVAAATEERERLARDIHDSVLQVLALVARRGAALGGEAAELGQLAGEQEVALRTLVATPLPLEDAAGEVDVRALLEPLARDRVSISGPATAVHLARSRAEELAAATRAALDNVERHAGDGARAWVLLEDDDEAVTVSVRDDGVGMAPDRLAAARRDGRLGVDQSILARMRSIGGNARIESTPGGGTEVELRVPRG